jgi:hypothetical protein
MIWSRTWRIMELLGLANELKGIAHAPPDGSLGTQKLENRALTLISIFVVF